MSKRIVSLSLLVAALGTAAVRADDAPKNSPDAATIFAQLDANQDGELVADEISTEHQQLFERLLRTADGNKDGKLSKGEFAAGLTKKAEPQAPGRPEGAEFAQRMFKRLDRNGDGRVTADEVPEERREMLQRMLEHFDKNGDKALSAEEFAEGVSRRARQNGRPPRAGNPEPPGPPRGGLFAALDTDHDGKLNAEEISVAADVIRKLDKNGDGILTPDELAPTEPRED